MPRRPFQFFDPTGSFAHERVNYHSAIFATRYGCASRNYNPAVLMATSAEDRPRGDVANR
jgi:hypothetical protein